MGEGGTLQVEVVGTPHGGTERLAVRDGTEVIAHVEVGRSRRRFDATGVVASTEPPGPLPSAAWPAASADRAAGARWADVHRSVLIASRLELAPGAGHRAQQVIEAAGEHLVGSGGRRLDLRVSAADPVAAWLHGSGWMRGEAGGTLVVSRSLRYPWSVPSPAAAARTGRAHRLPRPVRRLGRRLATVRPAHLPELARITAGEVAAAVRFRYLPGARHRAVDGAPAGTFPFQVTRYRTIRTALSLVPPPLRSERFVDIGCGDGRVLREAVDQGWGAVHGRELDPDLAGRARALVGDHGTVDAGDGLIAPLPDDAGVVFLNNPFQVDGLTQLATLLSESLARRPRPLVIIYINPRSVDPLTAVGFALVQCTPAFSMLTFVSG